MAQQQGMLSGLFGIPAIDPAAQKEEERLRALSGAGVNPLAYTAYSGGAQAGRGLGTAIVAATGRDPRAPAAKRTDAIEAAKAQVAQLGFDPEDPKSVDGFYKQVIQILQKQGLAGEALDVAREWHKQTVEDKKASLTLQESTRKQAKDLATDTRAKERNEILRENGIPEFSKYIDLAEKATDPATRQLYMERVNVMLGKAGKGIKVVDLGDTVQLVDAATGKPIGAEMDKGAVPMNEKDAAKATEKNEAQVNAYRNAMGAMQNTYNAAVRLYNHAGIGGITGRLGRLVGEPGAAGQTATTAASAESRAALALWKQISGTTFLEGLQQLRLASPVGSTGLGQVSNIEGDKVQSAAAALSREQDAADFRLNLKVYLGKLAEAAKALAAAAPVDKVTPIPLKEMPLIVPDGKPERRPVAAPAAPASDTVKMKLPDGRTGNIPRANIEAAKAAGAVEVK